MKGLFFGWLFLAGVVLHFASQHSFDFVLAVPDTQSFESDKAFLPCTFDRGVLAALNLIALLFQLLQKIFVVGGFLLQNFVDDAAQPVAVAFPRRVSNALLPFPVRLLFDYGELMLQTNQVAQPLYCQPREEKIPEFSCTIQRSGIVDDMIVNVFPVGMGGNDKGVFAFQKSGGQFVANLICFLCRDFTGPEGLPYLISNHIAFLAAPGGLLVQLLCEHELLIYGKRAALIAADKLTLFSLVRILCIVGAVFQADGNRFSFVLMQCNQTSSGQSRSPLQRKSRPKAAEDSKLNNIPEPTAESFNALHHCSCADKKDKAEKFSNQQNQKLIPSLAIDGIDAAAEDIQHQWCNNIAGQGKQPLCHQSQKSYKQRDRGKHHLEQNPHIKHQPFLSPLL